MSIKYQKEFLNVCKGITIEDYPKCRKTLFQPSPMLVRLPMPNDLKPYLDGGKVTLLPTKALRNARKILARQLPSPYLGEAVAVIDDELSKRDGEINTDNIEHIASCFYHINFLSGVNGGNVGVEELILKLNLSDCSEILRKLADKIDELNSRD